MRLERLINNTEPAKIYMILALLATLLFVPFLNVSPLFDWDENNFAEAAREMVVSGDYLRVQINFEPFYEKPPLFFWLQALFMHIFGVNEFAARLPNAICGIFTVLTLFHIGRKLYDNFFGLIWVVAYVGSFLPHFYFKSGIIDPVFNLFIFLGLYYFIRNSLEDNDDRNRSRNVIISGVFLGLAILTKGPVGLLIVALCVTVFLALKRFRLFFSWKELGIWMGVTVAVSFLWFGIDLLVNGPEMLRAFTMRQWELLTTGDAGHGQPFYYHFIVILIGCFPASVFMIKGHKKLAADTLPQNRFRKWMIILFWVVLILFSLVKTKIMHYSSMTYIPLTFLAAHFLYHLRYDEIRWNRIFTAGLGIFGFIFSAVFILLPLFGKNPDKIVMMIDDPFAVANLDAEVYWSGLEVIIGIIYLIITVTGLIYIVYHNYFKGAIAYFAATIIAIQLLMPFVVPKIERIVQGSAIDFYKTMRTRDGDIQVLGFKSYGYLFYSRSEEKMDLEQMLSGESGEPAYFVGKITNADEYIKRYNLQKIGEANGYVFMMKK